MTSQAPLSSPQHTELLFQRYQSTFIHTLEVGRQLFSMGDEETQNRLQTDLGALQEEWDNLHSLLGRRMDLTEAIIKVPDPGPGRFHPQGLVSGLRSLFVVVDDVFQTESRRASSICPPSASVCLRAAQLIQSAVINDSGHVESDGAALHLRANQL